MTVDEGLRLPVRAIVGELVHDAEHARVATAELHHALEALQHAVDERGWPGAPDELRDVAATIHTSVNEIAGAFLQLAEKVQQLAAIDDVIDALATPKVRNGG